MDKRFQPFSKTHDLKTNHQYFMDIKYAGKNFEVRFNDRDFRTGDTLILHDMEGEHASGETITVHVGYVLHGGQFGIDAGYVVTGLI